MDFEVRSSFREAVADPWNGLVRLRYASCLMRANRRAAACHELSAATDLGLRVPGELRERLAYVAPDGYRWEFVHNGAYPTEAVAPFNLADGVFPGALVHDERSLLPFPLVLVSCVACEDGWVPCWQCGDEPHRGEDYQPCVYCGGALVLPCSRCLGSALAVDRIALRETTSRCVHGLSWPEEEFPKPRFAKWRLLRCLHCRLAALDRASGAPVAFACAECGLFGCECRSEPSS